MHIQRLAAIAAAILACANPVAEPTADTTTVLVIRHAERAAVEGRDPPLSEAGAARRGVGGGARRRGRDGDLCDALSSHA